MILRRGEDFGRNFDMKLRCILYHSSIILECGNMSNHGLFAACREMQHEKKANIRRLMQYVC